MTKISTTFNCIDNQRSKESVQKPMLCASASRKVGRGKVSCRKWHSLLFSMNMLIDKMNFLKTADSAEQFDSTYQFLIYLTCD